jgi:hypothetical protein
VEIHRTKLYTCTVQGYSTGITGFWTRNPPEDRNSAGITSSWTWIQTGKIKNLPISNNSRIINSKLYLKQENSNLNMVGTKILQFESTLVVFALWFDHVTSGDQSHSYTGWSYRTHTGTHTHTHTHFTMLTRHSTVDHAQEERAGMPRSYAQYIWFKTRGIPSLYL